MENDANGIRTTEAGMTDRERYQRAAHAMQSGVAFEMNHDPKPTSPKHLRVGVNSAMVDSAAIAGLLIEKGVFTLEEYEKAIANQMEAEAESYERRAIERTGNPGLRFA